VVVRLLESLLTYLYSSVFWWRILPHMSSQVIDSKLRRKESYYFDCIVFQAEETLFKLPKIHFINSEPFKTIFTLPPGEKDVEGTDHNPFKLPVSEAEFESLLKVLYSVPFKNNTLTQQEWISVLNLSTMWDFSDIRKGAIDELSKDMGPIQKIKYGRNFGVEEWVKDGYVGLLKRSDPITDEEAKCLGWETAAKLFRLREQVYRTPPTSVTENCATCNRSGLVLLGSPPIHVLCGSCTGHGFVTRIVSHPPQFFIEAVQKEFPLGQ